MDGLENEKSFNENTIDEIIDEKLRRYQLPLINELDRKSKERLIQIERIIIRNSEEIKKHISMIRKLRLSIKAITDNEEVKFSRKTVYNDSLIRLYLDKSIEDEYDYFNDKKILELNKQIEEMKNEYYNIIDSIIENKNLEMEINACNNTIYRLENENKNANDIIKEKEKTIEILKKNIRMKKL